MASSRDDFVIAIRSAFLKKNVKQKFSLLTLAFLSIFIIILSGIDFKPIKKIKTLINEVVYRSSFIISLPENLMINSYSTIIEYSNFYKDYENIKIELKNLKSKIIINEIITNENKELKNLIEDYTFSFNKILAKVIVDHDSPFLRTIIINKGSLDSVKIGTNIYDENYLVGRVIEVNYNSSRVLLLSDLNSNLPISIVPGNIQAIITGNGKESGKIKYIKDNLAQDIEDNSIAYTSGTGALFKSGIPVGTVNNNNLLVNFYSDFSQLKYVFVEIKENSQIAKKKESKDSSSLLNTEKVKIDILNDEIKILDETNVKLNKVNTLLKSDINNSNNKINNLEKIIENQTKEINKNTLNNEELQFLRLNLLYSPKCRRSIMNLDGYKIGTKKYKSCILNKGKTGND